MKKPLFLQALMLGVATAMSLASHAQTLISANQPVTVSTTESGSYPGLNAVDGSTTTFWSSSNNNFNQWLYVDLGSISAVDKVEIAFADGRHATTLDVQFSNDAITWINAVTATNTQSSITFTGMGGYARYVKFNGRGRANSAGYRIADFRVWTPVPNTPTQTTEITTVLNRLKAHYSNKETGDLSAYINAMQPNGQFSNISYSGTGWTRHALYLNRIAAAYSTSSNAAYQDTSIPRKVMLGMRHLLGVHYTSGNWHDTQVRVPNNIATALVLMKGVIPQDSILAYIHLLQDYTANEGHKAANRAWVSLNVIRKGLLSNRYDVASRGYQSVVRGLNVTAADDDEGIMIDNSMHQHHDQLYTGGYGRSLIGDEVVYWRMASGTSFESYFTTTYKNNLINLMLGGLQVIGYRGSVDFGSIGRGVASPGGLVTAGAETLDSQKLNDPANAVAYDKWKAHLTGGPSAVLGAKYFWKSAILTSHGENYYLSAKVISTRTEGTEQLNNENLKGYNLPLGATNIMTTGTEYFDIFPTWHWGRIPGTTSEMNEDSAAVRAGFTGGYLTGTNTFGGGVAHNDDGIIAYEHNYKSLTAKKAYFFMDSMMVCMGNSITGSKTNEVVTTVNQTKSVGAITYNSPSTTLSVDSLTSNTINWVHHNNVGYLFPQGGYLSLTNKTQTGTWRSLHSSGTTATQSNLMFNLYVRHSPTPTNRTYFYIVAPDKQASDMTTLAANHSFVNVANTASVQAIRRDETFTKYAIVFYAAGQVDMGDGLIVKSNKKAVVIIRKYTTNYRVSVADPVYAESSIVITLNKELTGNDIVYSNGESAITFNLPSGDSKGSTLTKFCTIAGGSMQAPGITRSATTSKEETAGERVEVYPNPATSVLRIKGVSANAVVEIYDQSGVKHKTAKGNTIDLGGLRGGAAYSIRINDNGKLTTRQFIKQ
ncbi:MAG: discoidin domain-containing protein [Niastella sp.]|nr:discoidin domain-containing protein [Niastella sp.]